MMMNCLMGVEREYYIQAPRTTAAASSCSKDACIQSVAKFTVSRCCLGPLIDNDNVPTECAVYLRPSRRVAGARLACTKLRDVEIRV